MTCKKACGGLATIDGNGQGRREQAFAIARPRLANWLRGGRDLFAKAYPGRTTGLRISLHDPDDFSASVVFLTPREGPAEETIEPTRQIAAAWLAGSRTLFCMSFPEARAARVTISDREDPSSFLLFLVSRDQTSDVVGPAVRLSKIEASVVNLVMNRPLHGGEIQRLLFCGRYRPRYEKNCSPSAFRGLVYRMTKARGLLHVVPGAGYLSTPLAKLSLSVFAANP